MHVWSSGRLRTSRSAAARHRNEFFDTFLDTFVGNISLSGSTSTPPQDGAQWVYYNTFTTTSASLLINPTVRNTSYTYTVKAWSSVGQAPQSSWATFQYQ